MGMGSEDGGNGKNEMRPKMQIKCDLVVMMMMMMMMRRRRRIETMINLYQFLWVGGFGRVLGLLLWGLGAEYLGLIMIVTRGLAGLKGGFHLQRQPTGARSQLTIGQLSF